MPGRGGQNRKLSLDEIAEMVRLREDSPTRWTYSELGKKFGINKSTVGKYVNLAKDDPEQYQALVGPGRVFREDEDIEDDERERHRLLYDWEYIASEYQGLEVQDFHREGWEHVKKHLRPAIAMPRGWGKSEIYDIARAKQEILRSAEATRLKNLGEPVPEEFITDISIAVISATDDQVVKNVRAVKQFLERPKIAKLWGDFKTPGNKWTDSEFTIGHRTHEGPDPTMMAVSIGSAAATARHFDLIFLDDIVVHKNSETPRLRQKVKSWIANVLDGIAKPETQVVLINTPYHPECYITSAEKHNEFNFFKVPAIVERNGVEISNWPEYQPMRDGKRSFDGKRVVGLETKRERMERNLPGSFRAQFMLDASNVGGGKIDVSSIKGLTRRGLPNRMKVVQYCDFAWTRKKESDYTAIATVGLKDEKFYLIRVRRAKLSMEAIKKMVEQEHDRYEPSRIYAEKTGLQHKEVKNVLSSLSHLPWKKTQSSRSKEIRSLPLMNLIEIGDFFMVSDEPWCDQFRAELKRFPDGEYDDMVDAVCGAINNLARSTSSGLGTKFRHFMKQG